MVGSNLYSLNSELEREARQARLALLPLLQAEMDAQEVRRRTEQLAWEAKVMADRPDWVVGQSVYMADSKPARTARPLSII